ncbi:MAG: hypothetical protein PHV07_08780 [Oscillospiraceae bacterium]|nr:hypothetical protein [Oscillospiraceae bacterium]
MRQGGGRRRAIARRERQRSFANKRPRRLVDFYLELVLIINCFAAKARKGDGNWGCLNAMIVMLILMSRTSLKSVIPME